MEIRGAWLGNHIWKTKSGGKRTTYVPVEWTAVADGLPAELRESMRRGVEFRVDTSRLPQSLTNLHLPCSGQSARGVAHSDAGWVSTPSVWEVLRRDS